MLPWYCLVQVEGGEDKYGINVQGDITVQPVTESILPIASAEREARETEGGRKEASEYREHF